MSEIPDVSAAYFQQHRDKARIDELRETIAAFVDNPPEGMWQNTLAVLSMAVDRLGHDSASIVRTWD